MKLWLLQPRQDVLLREAHPWIPPYDKVRAVAVRAADEPTARGLAQSVAGHEGLGIYRAHGASEDEVAERVWLDPSYTTCDVLGTKGEPSVIIVDRWEG